MNLDSLDLKKVDPSDMYDRIFRFPEQLEKAAEIGCTIKIELPSFDTIRNIVVAGMGGSAIGGDLVRSFLGPRLKIPFAVCRNYHLPGYVDNDSLVMASSYSGNTEETLSAYQEAVARGARIIAITTGGKLADLAARNNHPIITIPGGFPPRSALGFSVVPILFIMEKLGIIEGVEKDLDELVRGLKNYREIYAVETPKSKNPAKSLAAKLLNRIPLIYTGPDLTEVIGTRWKGQICENAESLAFNNQFPEFNHNELVGFNKIDPYRNHLIALFLRDSDDHERIQKRMSVVKGYLENNGIEVVDVISQGDFPLGRIFSLIQIGDFASFYLAVLNGVDPTPVKAIDFLKQKLVD
nr:bifunctional phosphoglucose/phosphomannose isomerase [candidate division Zixibacteria bacterium]